MFSLERPQPKTSPMNRLKNSWSILKVWVGRAALLQHKRLGVLLKPKVQGNQKVLLRFPQGVALPRWRRSVWSFIYGSTAPASGTNRCKRWTIFWITIFILRNWNKSRPVRFLEFWERSKVWEKCSRKNWIKKNLGHVGGNFSWNRLPREGATRRGAYEPALLLAGKELSRLKESLLSASHVKG